MIPDTIRNSNTIAVTRFMDGDTGELLAEVQAPQHVTERYKKMSVTRTARKIDGTLTGGERQHLHEAMLHSDPYSKPLSLITVKAYAEAYGRGNRYAYLYLAGLMKKDAVRRVSRGVYAINPHILSSGGRDTFNWAVAEWEALEQDDGSVVPAEEDETSSSFVSPNPFDVSSYDGGVPVEDIGSDRLEPHISKRWVGGGDGSMWTAEGGGLDG